jgi:uncharacterized RDD family membrane protein YckC
MIIPWMRQLGAVLGLLVALGAAGQAVDDKAGALDSPADQQLEWGDRTATPPRHRRKNHGDVVHVLGDSTLQSGEQADSVVSILGSSTSDGDATDVVSVFGNTRVTGPVGNSAVAVFGNNTVDSKVGGDVVAVFGDVVLGPHASVDGDVVSVFGAVHKDPAAVVNGGTENVLGGEWGGTEWLHAWIRECLLKARPLALAPGLSWAWTLALACLAVYAAIALLFPAGVNRCLQTLEAEPGHTALSALIAILLVPVLIVLLCVTVIGIAAIPFVLIALFCATLFGKSVIMAWLGLRVAGRHPPGHPAVAVIIGGFIVLLLYLVPVLGFLAYNILGFFGLGVVIYTLILTSRQRQNARADGRAVPPPRDAGAAAAGIGGAAMSAGTAGADSTAPAASAAPGVNSSAAGFAAGAPSAPVPGPEMASLPRAGFWIRMAALLLDIILIGVLSSMLHPFAHFHLLFLAAYGAVMWKLRGSTVGGLVCDLRVVRSDGRPIEWETAIVRALGCFLSLAVCGLGFIWIAFDPGHQAWHDKIAGTVVVRVPKSAP